MSYGVLLGLLLSATTSLTLAQSQYLTAVHSGSVVATRGDVELTVDLIDQEVAAMPPEIRAGYLDDPTRFSRMVDSLLLTKQLATEAMHRGIMLEERDDVGMPKTLSDLNALANALLATQNQELSTESYELLARERWQARGVNYATEEAFVFRHVFTHSDMNEPDNRPLDEAMNEARILARTFKDRIDAGENFFMLARELGGERAEQWIEEHRLTLMQVLKGPKSLQQALVQLRKQPGVSEIIEDGVGGYHIYALTTYEPPVRLPFEDVSEQIIDEIKNESLSNARTTFMRSFSLQDVHLNDDVIQALPARYAEKYGQTDSAGSGSSPPVGDLSF